MFGIFPEDKVEKVEGELVLPASIVIDEFSEMTHIPLSYWSIKDYKSCWLKSIAEGLTSKKHAALAVSMYETDNTNFIFTWVLYFCGSKVLVQNTILFLDECQGFSAEKINEFIKPRITHNDDGIKISEWSTDLESVISFYESLKDEMGSQARLAKRNWAFAKMVELSSEQSQYALGVISCQLDLH